MQGIELIWLQTQDVLKVLFSRSELPLLKQRQSLSERVLRRSR